MPLTWPVDFDVLDLKRFETNARTLRYQALGRACRANGITDLLVAHHADDQAETVMMRLASNRLRSGLQAMQPLEWIPECHGIYGVSHSGASSDHSHHDHAWKPHGDLRQARASQGAKLPVETGGVRVLRPLLEFEKSRLIATCQQHGVAWAEDKTNKLQTLTSRNAVRHILKNYKLPVALSVQSLVDTSSYMRTRVNMHKLKAHDVLRDCPKQLDLQTGSLLIQFPPFHRLLGNTVESPKRKIRPQHMTPNDWNSARNTAICLLAQASQMVSPKNNPSPGELASRVGNIWSEFNHPEMTESYCAHGIWWRKWDNPLQGNSKKSYRTYTGRQLSGHVDRQWLLTRQPLEKHRAAVSPAMIQYPPSPSLPATQGEPPAPTTRKLDFQLFDSRWWIHVENHSPDELILRHFTKDDLDHMASRKDAVRGSERYAAVALSMIKPADIRFTLPALFRRDELTKEERLIGFPTLDVSTGQLGYPKDICSWRVHYKKLDCDAALDSNIADTCSFRGETGVSHRTIEREVARLNRTAKGKSTRPDTNPSSGDAFDDHAAPSASTKKIVRRPRARSVDSAVSAVSGMSAMSNQHGGSETYTLEWEDLYPEDPYKVSGWNDKF